ncbi:helix-turn-helix domain-containing protein [Pasteurellaceae bacterium LIM206]|nr:helix-turn-helix domain-containing protein [Pasteurellaceae bacterium LIM206]
MAVIETFLYEDNFINNSLLAFSYTDPEDNTIEHTHEFDELVIVDKGYGVQIFNGEPYFIQEGDVFLVKENDRHFYIELGTLKLMNIQINTRYQFQYLKNVMPLLEQFYIKNVSIFSWLMPKAKESCVERIRTLDFYLSDYKGTKLQCLQIETLFMQILSLIMTNEHTNSNNSTQFKIRNVLLYLQQNYAEQIDWKKLSEHFFITNKTMTRKIKELTGMSPVKYLNRLRVLAARDKLRHLDDSITNIAVNCGFNNSDYFTRCYKKNFGISPSDERKLIM